MSKPSRAILLVLISISIGAGIVGGMYYFAVHESEFANARPIANTPATPKPTALELEKSRFPDLTQENLDLERFVSPRKPRLQTENSKLEGNMGPTAKDFQRYHEQFLRQICEHYDSRSSDASFRESEIAFIDQWIMLTSAPGQYSVASTVDRLSAAATSANPAESSDALVKSIYGFLLLRQGSVEEAKTVLSGLSNELLEQGYSLYLQSWVAAMQLQCEKTYRDSPSPEAVARFCPIAIQWMTSVSKETSSFRFAWTTMALGLSQMSVDQQSTFVADVLSADAIDPWFLHMVTAEFLKNKSWETRGRGYADTVNKLQWKGFEELQQRASLHYQKAWLLRPEMPFASHEMIMISMAHGDKWSPREWFDITRQAQRDYEPAFESYLHTLKPRWGGSLGAMFDFADECARGGDHETLVPSFALHVIKVAGEEMPESPDKVLDHPALISMLQRFWVSLDQALMEGKAIPEGRLHVLMSWRAAIAMRERDLESLRIAISHLKMPVWEYPFAVLFPNPQMVVSQSYAAARCGETVLDLGERFRAGFDGRMTAAAIEECRKQIDEVSDGAASEEAQFFNSLRAILSQLEKFHAGEWVDLKFTPDMQGWTVRGDASVESEESVLLSNHTSEAQYPAISPLTPFAPPYVVLARIEGIRGSRSLRTAGIQVGSLYPDPGTSESTGRFFYANTNEDIAGSSGGTWESDGGWEIDGLARPVSFRVRVFSDAYEMQVNGIPLPLKSPLPFVGSSRIQFGAGERHGDRGAVRISDVRIHRLELEKPDTEVTDAGIWKPYLESIVTFDETDSHALMSLASLYAQEKDWKKAESCVVQILKNGSLANGDPGLVLQILMEAGDYSNAKTVAEAVLKTPHAKPEYVEVLAWICAAASDDGLREPARSLELASQILEQNPPTWKGLRAASAAYAENGKFSEAVSFMEKALDAAPEDQKAAVSEMVVVLKSGRPVRSP